MTIKKELKLALVAKRLAMLQADYSSPPVLCPENPVQSSISRKRRRVIINDSDCSEDEKLTACTPPRKTARLSSEKCVASAEKSSHTKRAEEIQANLSKAFPSFIKLMLKSNVSGEFCLDLPSEFCDEHLPICDTTVVLVDEAGKEYETVYLAKNTGLKGGWMGFSIDHNLVDGDILIFHLIAYLKFKVHIIRKQNFNDIDGALGLLSLNHDAKQEKSEHYSQKLLQTEDNYPLTNYRSQGNSNADLGFDTLGGIYFSDSNTNIEEVKDFENFHINVDGLILDSKFSETTRKEYYKLCCEQNCFLHEHLLKGLNCTLVVGIISGTISIAEAIRSTSTSNENLEIWDRTLKGFELLGMKVNFLRRYVNKLQGHASESNTVDETNRLTDIRNEKNFAGEKWKAIENKFMKLYEMMEELDSELEEFKISSKWKQDSKIKMVADFPLTSC